MNEDGYSVLMNEMVITIFIIDIKSVFISFFIYKQLDTSQLTGTNVVAEVEGILDGGVWFDPIMGDLLRTYHTSAQVLVFVNDLPMSCVDDTSCQYGWSSSLTPSVSSISPSSGENIAPSKMYIKQFSKQL